MAAAPVFLNWRLRNVQYDDMIWSVTCTIKVNQLYFTLYGASELRMGGAIANPDDMI